MIGMSEVMLIVYSELLNAPGRGLHGMELIRRTGISPGTLYVMLERGASRGHIVRTPEEATAEALGRTRRIHNALTPAGRDLVVSTMRRILAASLRMPSQDGAWMLIQIDTPEYMSEGETCAMVAERLAPQLIRDQPVHPLDVCTKRLYLLPGTRPTAQE